MSTDAGSVASAHQEGAATGSFEEFVASLEFVSVETMQLSAERTGAGNMTNSEGSMESSVAVDPGQNAIFYRYDQALRALGEAGDEIGRVQVTLVLVFTTPMAAAPSEHVERFGAGPGMMMAYPYLREAVMSMGSRIGVHGLLLPIMRP